MSASGFVFCVVVSSFKFQTSPDSWCFSVVSFKFFNFSDVWWYFDSYILILHRICHHGVLQIYFLFTIGFFFILHWCIDKFISCPMVLNSVFLISLLCVAVCSLAVIAVSNGKTDWNIGLMSTATLLGVIKKFHQPKGTKQASFKAVSSWSTSSIPGFLPHVERSLEVSFWYLQSYHGPQTCAESKHQLLQQTDPTFMSKIITSGESCVTGFDPETQEQSAVSKPEEGIIIRSGIPRVCLLFCFCFFNNHNEFIPCGQAVCAKLHYKVLQCLSESIWLKLPACHLAPGYNTI